MRVFALILLFFICFLFCAAAALKYAEWPGGSFGLLSGTFLYIVIYTPVFLIFALRNPALQPVKRNIIAGSVGTAIALAGLLFFNLHWDESLLPVILASLALVPALILFFIKQQAHAEAFKSYRLFRIVTIVILIASASCIIPMIAKNNRMNTEMLRFHDARDDYFAAESKLKETGMQLAISDSVAEKIQALFAPYSDADFKVADAQMELIAIATGYRKEEINNVPPEFIPWDDADLVEMLFVGFDPENPQGKALEIGTALRQLKLNLQAKGMDLDVDIPASDSKADLTLWVKNNFHSKDIAQAMTLLYSFRAAIANQLRKDLENNFAPKE